MTATNNDWLIQEPHNQNLVLFNVSSLSDEPVSDEDLVRINVHGPEMYAARCATWSAGASWFVVGLPDCLVFANAHTGSGVMCRKRSWKLIEAYLDAPIRRRFAA